MAKKFKLKWRYPFLAVIGLLCFWGYTHLWWQMAERAADSYVRKMEELDQSARIKRPEISGFPGSIKLSALDQSLDFPAFKINIQALEGRLSPFSYDRMVLYMGEVSLRYIGWSEVILLDHVEIEVSLKDSILNIHQGNVYRNPLVFSAKGTVDLSQYPLPKMDLQLAIKNPEDFIDHLVKIKAIPKVSGQFINGGLLMLADTAGVINIPLQQKGESLYLGPLPIISDVFLGYKEQVSPADSRPLEPYNSLGPGL